MWLVVVWTKIHQPSCNSGVPLPFACFRSMFAGHRAFQASSKRWVISCRKVRYSSSRTREEFPKPPEKVESKACKGLERTPQCLCNSWPPQAIQKSNGWEHLVVLLVSSHGYFFLLARAFGKPTCTFRTLGL